MRRSNRGSIPRLVRKGSTGGVGISRRSGGGPAVRRGPGGGGTLVLSELAEPQLVGTGSVQPTEFGYRQVSGYDYYPEQEFAFPEFVQRQGTPPPLSSDCMQLQVGSRWATVCFKPAYHRFRMMHGNDHQSIVDDLIFSEVPGSAATPRTAAEGELRRRVGLSTAALMNKEGTPVRYPPRAVYPKPRYANQIHQPWLRALLTGYL